MAGATRVDPLRRRPAVSIARTLTIAAAGMGLALGGVALAPAASAASHQTVVVNCLGKGVVKPKEIVLACADAGILVHKITWSKWTANEAVGKGTLVWNTCLPTDCAGGIVQQYSAKIKLGRVASGPNISVFSGMTLTFQQYGGPAGSDSATYTLDFPIAS
jgi:hypothetical protein